MSRRIRILRRLCDRGDGRGIGVVSAGGVARVGVLGWEGELRCIGVRGRRNDVGRHAWMLHRHTHGCGVLHRLAKKFTLIHYLTYEGGV